MDSNPVKHRSRRKKRRWPVVLLILLILMVLLAIIVRVSVLRTVFAFATRESTLLLSAVSTLTILPLAAFALVSASSAFAARP